jgi:hypothetical protein
MNRELLWACLLPASTPKVGGHLYLTMEPISAECGSEFWPEDLQRYLAVKLHVLGEIDGGHATTTQLALNAVAVSQRRFETFQQVSHGQPSRGPALSYDLRLETARF